MAVQQSPSIHALVADDMPDNRDIFTIVLQMAGYEVTTAANGQEALDILAAQPFHLMILDLDMPVLNGRDVLLALQNQPEHRPNYIMIVTANAQMNTETVIKLSDFVIIKPIVVKEVVTLAKRLNPNIAAS